MKTWRPKFHSRGSRITGIPPGYTFLAPQIVQRIDLLTLGTGVSPGSGRSRGSDHARGRELSETSSSGSPDRFGDAGWSSPVARG